MTTKDIVKFKLLIIFTLVLWIIYDLTIQSYTAAVFDILTIITNIVGIIKLKKKNRVIDKMSTTENKG